MLLAWRAYAARTERFRRAEQWFDEAALVAAGSPAMATSSAFA
jgi:hypothetical protein